jgi:spore maturation protein CgeB
MKNKIKGKIFFAAWASKNKRWHTYQALDGPLRKLFEEVIVFDPQEVINTHGKEVMNKKFLEIAKKEKPDYVLLWFVYDEFDPETLIKLREILPESILLCYNGDDDYKFSNYTLNFFPLVDYFLTTQPQFIKEYKKYKKKAFFSCGVDTARFRPLNLKKKYDVSFVGAPKSDRVEYMKYLLKNKIKVTIGGANWESYPEFGEAYLGGLADEDFVKLINQSKINICLSKNYLGGTHILERFFEFNACKSFGLTEFAEGYSPTFKEGRDMVTFKDKKELLEKVRYYLKNSKKREKIAKAAYKKTNPNFSYDLMMENAFNYMQKKKSTLPKGGVPKIKKKFVYLSLDDLSKGKKYLNKYLKNYDYIGFKHKGYELLPHKEYFQIHSLELLKKPINCCDCYLSSYLIGDYAAISLNYAYGLKDKSCFYDNLDISQIMVKKQYFLNNLHKFISLYNNKIPSFINEENTIFMSLPFVRTKKRKKIPLKDVDHVLFTYFERELLVLKNNKKLFTSSYLYKLILYLLLYNHQSLKYFFKYTLKRTKNPKLIKIASFVENLIKI